MLAGIRGSLEPHVVRFTVSLGIQFLRTHAAGLERVFPSAFFSLRMSSNPLLLSPTLPEKPFRELTEDEWSRVAQLLPEMKTSAPRRGRPHADIRQVVNGIFWVLHHRKPWSALPNTYPVHQTCHRHFQRWHENGVLSVIATELFGSDTICADYGLRSRRMVVQARPLETLTVDWPARR